MRRKIKTVVNAIFEYVTILAWIAIIYFAILWIVERCLPAHIWEAFVDAFNRFFGGKP
jgi:ABC-type amino acid transport system permease subunit